MHQSIYKCIHELVVARHKKNPGPSSAPARKVSNLKLPNLQVPNLKMTNLTNLKMTNLKMTNLQLPNLKMPNLRHWVSLSLH